MSQQIKPTNSDAVWHNVGNIAPPPHKKKYIYNYKYIKLLVIVTSIVDFHSFLLWLGCGSSLTSGNFACPISLNMGD